LKRLVFFSIILLCSLSSHSAFAALKVGYVNALRIMDAAPQVEDASKRLEREFEPRQRRIISSQREVRRLEERLAKEGEIMSASQLTDLRKDIRNKRRDLKREQDEFREDYNIRRNEELDKVQKKIMDVIQDLAKDESYDMILGEGVIWASKKVDITNKVLKRLERLNRRR